MTQCQDYCSYFLIRDANKTTPFLMKQFARRTYKIPKSTMFQSNGLSILMRLCSLYYYIVNVKFIVICISLLNHQITGFGHRVWQAYLNMSQNRSSKIYLFSFENIQNNPPNPAISRFNNGIKKTRPLVHYFSYFQSTVQFAFQTTAYRLQSNENTAIFHRIIKYLIKKSLTQKIYFFLMLEFYYFL